MFTFTPLSHLKYLSDFHTISRISLIPLIPPTLPLPSLQEEQLNEILAEVRALKAVVMAQGQRIDILERQLARIEDGDV